MKSKIAERIYLETPDEVKEKVRQYANYMTQAIDQTKFLLEKSIEFQRMKTKIEAIEAEHALVCDMLSQMCSGYESFFESDEKFLSDEDMADYLKAAKYLKFHKTRSDGGMIRRMEDKRDDLPY